jgi:Asp-tRNA(Asn)/Glu-tRNA(Gln) amidotransferase B subunit
MLGEAEDTMATALYDIESDSPGFLDDLIQMISDNHTQASFSDSTPPGFDNRIDQANGIDQMMMRAFLSERHFNSMWEAFLDLSSLAGQMETWIAQEGADRAMEEFMSQFGRLDADFQQEVVDIITGIQDGTIAPGQAEV